MYNLDQYPAFVLPIFRKEIYSIMYLQENKVTKLPNKGSEGYIERINTLFIRTS